MQHQTAKLTWVFASVKGDALAIYLKTILTALDVTIICAVHGVVLEHVCSILGIAEGVVDGYDLDIRVLHSSTQDKPADAAEPIDANLDLVSLSHVKSVLCVRCVAIGVRLARLNL